MTFVIVASALKLCDLSSRWHRKNGGDNVAVTRSIVVNVEYE